MCLCNVHVLCVKSSVLWTSKESTWPDDGTVRLPRVIALRSVVLLVIFTNCFTYYFSFRFKTLMNASLGTSTFPMLRIFFFPSACFLRSFIFRVISPPYCGTTEEKVKCITWQTKKPEKFPWCNFFCLRKRLFCKVLTHFAKTFFLYALILHKRKENR